MVTEELFDIFLQEKNIGKFSYTQNLFSAENKTKSALII